MQQRGWRAATQNGKPQPVPMRLVTSQVSARSHQPRMAGVDSRVGVHAVRSSIDCALRCAVLHCSSAGLAAAARRLHRAERRSAVGAVKRRTGPTCREE